MSDEHGAGSHVGGQAVPQQLEELRQMVRDGSIDTVIVALTDMQGRLMGKRVQAEAFLKGVVDHGIHFCTYLLGTDMEMNTPDGFKLMNWETGYGDWIGREDKVGLHLQNGSEYLEGMLAAFKLRAVPINVNYRYVEDELRYLLDDADA